MTVSTSRLSYSDVFEVFDRALSEPNGIRIGFPSKGKATHFRLRMNQARVIDRQDNRKIYTAGDPMYGQSPYDQLSFHLKEVGDNWYVYVIPRLNADKLNIEPLDEFEDVPEKKAEAKTLVLEQTTSLRR